LAHEIYGFRASAYFTGACTRVAIIVGINAAGLEAWQLVWTHTGYNRQESC
jgi:ABC-type microcin C transport system permease subunit YejE